jgi:hypothetical protein
MAMLYSMKANATLCLPQSVSDVQIAFIGTVVSSQSSLYRPYWRCVEQSESRPSCGGRLVQFKVQEVLRQRGTLKDTVSVLDEDSCKCDGGFWEKDERYLVIAQPNNTKLTADLIAGDYCEGTSKLSDSRATELIKEL